MALLNRWFARVTTVVGKACGHPLAFILSLLMVLAWLVTGSTFAFTDVGQLVMTVVLSILTYLLGFVIQSTSARNAAALHLKMDEILRAIPEARTDMAKAHLEDAPDEVLEAERQHFEELADAATEDQS